MHFQLHPNISSGQEQQHKLLTRLENLYLYMLPAVILLAPLKDSILFLLNFKWSISRIPFKYNLNSILFYYLS